MGAESIRVMRPGKPHVHDRCELAVCIEGDGIVNVDGEDVPVAEGGTVYIGAGKKHHMIPYAAPMVMVILYDRRDEI